MSNIRTLLWFVFYLALSNNVFSTEIKSIGVPFVQNYTKSVYRFGNQNWSVCKDKQGILYFGNGEGLLVFDGVYWQKYKMPNNVIIRAVASDDKGRIFAGGFGELGYWQYGQNGRLAYHSLTHLIPEKYALKDEAWKIYVEGDKVYFQSFASIFIYEKGKMQVLKADSPFLFLLKAGKRFFVEVISKGLFELHGRSLKAIPGSSKLGSSGVLSILPYKNSFLIGTAKNGLFIYDGMDIQPWQNQANSFLKAYQLNNGTVVAEKYFAFGTILNGLIIIDGQGRVIQQINKASGMQNNTVLSLFADDEYNLWLGLDNGIDRIELNSPLYFYLDRTGRFGTVYSSIIFQDKIYLGTNQGLFYSDWQNTGNYLPFDFKLIEGSQGQVWDLSLQGLQLFCGHNEGTFEVEGHKLRKISSINGGWTIKRLRTKPDYLIQGAYTGLVLYQKDAEGKWQFGWKISGFGEPSRYVEEDENGNLWVSHAYKGVYKLRLSKDLRSVKATKVYSWRDGLPTDYNVNLFNFESTILFSTHRGFYIYDGIADTFQPYKQLNSKLGSFAFSNKVIKASDAKYWFINNGIVALADIEPGKIKIDSSHFSSLNGRMVQHYENISRIGDSIYLISADDGFVIFNQGIDTAHAPVNKKVLIRNVLNIGDSGSVISESGNGTDRIELPYKGNSIRISFALPYYRKANIQYQYKLEGYSKDWTGWSSESQKDFTNLDAGSYQFLVKSRINNVVLPGLAEFKFIILNPWYLSNWAVFVYLVVGFLLFLVLRHFYYLKLARHQEEIQLKLKQEQEDAMRKELIANEQKIIQIKNGQLQNELAGKSRELANSAMNIVLKNELLQKIKHEILELKDTNGKKLSSEQLKRIDKIITEAMSDEGDWNLFEKSFNEAHENFFKKLKAGHKDLVPNDLKLCAYLRMNMNSKEIASLLNISLRGVEIRRYRLRKKLNVSHEKNLTEFLLEL